METLQSTTSHSSKFPYSEEALLKDLTPENAHADELAKISDNEFIID